MFAMPRISNLLYLENMHQEWQVKIIVFAICDGVMRNYRLFHQIVTICHPVHPSIQLISINKYKVCSSVGSVVPMPALRYATAKEEIQAVS